MPWCRSCGLPVVFGAVEPELKRMPIDARRVGSGFVPVEVEDGNVVATGRTVNGGDGPLVQVFRVEGWAEGRDGSVPRFRSHFVSCPQSRKWRKRR